MAEVLPFPGIRYDTERVRLTDVVSPPYDVIDGRLQDELYGRSPYNVVRLDLGKALNGDDPEENRYTRADRLLRQWLREGVLVQEERPCVYYVEEEYEGEFSERKTRKGFIGAVRIEDPESGLYRPHEKTLAGPKEDRLRLVEACRANLSPVFSLFDDPEDRVLRVLEAEAGGAAPLGEAEEEDGTRVRIWRLDEARALETVSSGLEGSSFFIADGHHRYETALAYRDLMRRAHPGFSGREPWNYVMMYLSNLRSPGLSVLPTHRAVFGLEGFELADFLERLQAKFEVRELPAGSADELQRRLAAFRSKAKAFVLVAKGSAAPWLVALRDETGAWQGRKGDVPEALRELDVTVLHSLILEDLLGIGEAAQQEQRNLKYVKDVSELLRVVRDDPEVQLGVVMNPTRIEQVKAVAEQGLRMPQKSTYFYPKLRTGLVINPLEEGEEH